MFFKHIHKITRALKEKSKSIGSNEYMVKKTNKSIIIKMRGDTCLGMRFIAIYDPLKNLSSAHLNKIEQYMYNFSTFLSMLHDDIMMIYSKTNEQYDEIIKKVESKINKLRIMLELGDNDIKKMRELKILEKIHENLLNSRNVYRLLLLFVIRTINKCDNIEEVLDKKTEDLLSLIDTYLDLKPRFIKPDEILDRFSIIPLLNNRILMDKKRTILIIGDRGAALLPFDRNYTNIVDIDLSGVYIGYDMVTNRPIMLSPEKHLKFHGIVIGPTGKGKTTLLASIFVRTSVMNYKVVAIDFKGDMSQYLNGIVTVLYGINLRQLIEEYRKKGLDLNKWIFYISKIWANVLSLRKSESYILFKALQRVIKENEDLSMIPEYIDNNEYLKLNLNSNSYDRIIESIEVLSPENDSKSIINNSYILNLERYPDYIKELLSSIILSFEMNMNKPLTNFNKLILVDEAWRLRKINPNILSALYREGRSLGIGVFSSSQLLRDLPSAVIENAHTFIIFGSQSKDYINDIRSLLNLTNKELEKLSNLRIGEAAIVLKDSKRPIWVRIVSETSFDRK